MGSGCERMEHMNEAKFAPGQLIHHVRFDYRGVIYDVDAEFSGTERWYAQIATSKPPRDAPWYRVLVDGASHTTYVAERNLEADVGFAPIEHPLLETLFDGFEDGTYLLRKRVN